MKGGISLRVLLALSDEGRLVSLRNALEARDEHTVCALTSSGQDAFFLLTTQDFDLCLIDAVLKDVDGLTLLMDLYASPPWVCPYTLLIGQSSLADACCLRSDRDEALIGTLLSLFGRPQSRLYESCEAARQARTRALLDQIKMPPALKGRRYLEALIPLALAHLKYRENLKYTLYHYAAARFDVTGESVERCIRHAIETTFSHGALAAIERFFGQSYDPERGKPTNREFIAMALIHLKEDFAYDLLGTPRSL